MGRFVNLLVSQRWSSAYKIARLPPSLPILMLSGLRDHVFPPSEMVELTLFISEYGTRLGRTPLYGPAGPVWPRRGVVGHPNLGCAGLHTSLGLTLPLHEPRGGWGFPPAKHRGEEARRVCGGLSTLSDLQTVSAQRRTAHIGPRFPPGGGGRLF